MSENEEDDWKELMPALIYQLLFAASALATA